MPDWAAVVLALASPLAALGGVWLGSRLQSRSELERWRLERRFDRYSEMGLHVQKSARATGEYLLDPSPTNKAAFITALDELDRSHIAVIVIAPVEVAAKGTRFVEKVLDKIYPMTQSGASLAEAERVEFMGELMELAGEFFVAVREDLLGTATP